MADADFTEKKMVSEKKKKEITDLLFYLSLIVLPLVQFVIFYVVVNANSIALAFKHYEYNAEGQYVASAAYFDNFVQVIKDLFTKEELKYCFRNSLVFYVVTFASGTVVSLIFSFYIFKKRLFSGTFKTFLYMPSIVSVMVISVLFRYFCEDCYPAIVEKITGKTVAGYSEHKYALIVLFNFFISCGGNMLVYTGTMAGISDSVIEASEVDGVNSVQQFWYIVLPQIFQTFSLFVVTGLLVFFSGQANMFNFFGLRPDPEFYTFGYYMYVQIAKNVNDYAVYSYLSAFGLIITAVAIPVIFAARYLFDKFGPKEI